MCCSCEWRLCRDTRTNGSLTCTGATFWCVLITGVCAGLNFLSFAGTAVVLTVVTNETASSLSSYNAAAELWVQTGGGFSKAFRGTCGWRAVGVRRDTGEEIASTAMALAAQNYFVNDPRVTLAPDFVAFMRPLVTPDQTRELTYVPPTKNRRRRQSAQPSNGWRDNSTVPFGAPIDVNVTFCYSGDPARACSDSACASGSLVRYSAGTVAATMVRQLCPDAGSGSNPTPEDGEDDSERGRQRQRQRRRRRRRLDESRDYRPRSHRDDEDDDDVNCDDVDQPQLQVVQDVCVVVSDTFPFDISGGCALKTLDEASQFCAPAWVDINDPDDPNARGNRLSGSKYKPRKTRTVTIADPQGEAWRDGVVPASGLPAFVVEVRVASDPWVDAGENTCGLYEVDTLEMDVFMASALAELCMLVCCLGCCGVGCRYFVSTSAPDRVSVPEPIKGTCAPHVDRYAVMSNPLHIVVNSSGLHEADDNDGSYLAATTATAAAAAGAAVAPSTFVTGNVKGTAPPLSHIEMVEPYKRSSAADRSPIGKKKVTPQKQT